MLRVPIDGLNQGDVILDAEAARYVARVHRKRAGETLLLFDPARAVEAEATIVTVERDRIVCHVNAVGPATMRPIRAVTLLQGIGKGEKLDAIVRDATELSATRIVAVESARSIVRLDEERSRARRERWNRIAIEAARQSGRGDAPTIEGPLGWAEAMRANAESNALKLCFWERAEEPARAHLRSLSTTRAVVIAVGPEGGLEEAEVEQAEEAGFHIVSLGPFTLRTETVAAAVLGAILLCGDSGSG